MKCLRIKMEIGWPDDTSLGPLAMRTQTIDDRIASTQLRVYLRLFGRLVRAHTHRADSRGPKYSSDSNYNFFLLRSICRYKIRFLR